MMDFKKQDMLLVVIPPILLAPIATGYAYLGLVFLYALIAGYFRYARD